MSSRNNDAEISKIVMGCAVSSSVIWSISFGIFTFHKNVDCSNIDLITFSNIAFWLFITCAVLELIIITLILVDYYSSSYSKFWEILTFILFVVDIGLSLFIYIRGMVAVIHSNLENGCESLYYLLLIYVIILSVLIGLVLLAFIIICICALCE